MEREERDKMKSEKWERNDRTLFKVPNSFLTKNEKEKDKRAVGGAAPGYEIKNATTRWGGTLNRVS